MKHKQIFVIPPQELLDNLKLDPNSPSYLSWKTKPKGHIGNNMNIRTKTTSKFSHVYYFCVWKKKQYFAHKIVYMLHNGITPSEIKNQPIDHIDRNTFNNNPSNLRQVSHNINRKNSNTSSSTGYKGIYKCERRGKYEIQLRKDNICRTFGTKTNLEDAIMTYIKAHELLWPEEHLPDEYIAWCKDANNLNKLNNFVLIDTRRETTKYSKRKNITFCKSKNKWHSFHKIENNRIFLGQFKTEEEAILAQDFAIKHDRRGSKIEIGIIPQSVGNRPS